MPAPSQIAPRSGESDTRLRAFDILYAWFTPGPRPRHGRGAGHNGRHHNHRNIHTFTAFKGRGKGARLFIRTLPTASAARRPRRRGGRGVRRGSELARLSRARASAPGGVAFSRAASSGEHESVVRGWACPRAAADMRRPAQPDAGRAAAAGEGRGFAGRGAGHRASRRPSARAPSAGPALTRIRRSMRFPPCP